MKADLLVCKLVLIMVVTMAASKDVHLVVWKVFLLVDLSG